MRDRWKLYEIVVTTILAVALSVFWLTWTWVFYGFFEGPLKTLHPGLPYLFSGIWVLGGTVIPGVLRRPGAALMGELLAASFGGLITQWGWTSLIWGFFQGGASEVVFALGRYKHWGLPTLILSGTCAGGAFWGVDFVYYNFSLLPAQIWAVQVFFSLVSGAGLAGVLGWVIVQALRRSDLVQS